MAKNSNQSEHDRISDLEAQVPQIAEQVASLTAGVQQLTDTLAAVTSAVPAGVAPAIRRPVLFDPGFALGLPLFAPPPPPPPTKIITLDDDPNISGECDQGGALVQKDLGPGSYYVSVKNNSADCDVTIKVVPKILPGNTIVLPAAGKGGKLGGGFFSLTTPMTLVITCTGGKKGSVCSIAYNLKQYL